MRNGRDGVLCVLCHGRRGPGSAHQCRKNDLPHCALLRCELHASGDRAMLVGWSSSACRKIYGSLERGAIKLAVTWHEFEVKSELRRTSMAATLHDMAVATSPPAPSIDRSLASRIEYSAICE